MQNSNRMNSDIFLNVLQIAHSYQDLQMLDVIDTSKFGS